MKRTTKSAAREVPLPFSDGLLSAKLWQAHDRFVVGVPELGLCCYGASETEASFRLFTTLIKYYRQLKSFQERLNEKGTKDLVVLSHWMQGIEDRLSAVPETAEPSYARTGKLLTMTPRISR
jgi:hypothetical protein